MIRLVLIAIFFTGCNPLIEVNIVQRATVSNGDGTVSKQHDSTSKEEESKLSLLVPLK